MHYYFGTYSNGYCGCDEEYLLSGNEDELEMYKIFEDALLDVYGFAYSDERFIDVDREEYDSDEEYEEAWEEAEEEYQQQCFEESGLEEITKEQYEEYKNDGYPILYEGKIEG